MAGSQTALRIIALITGFICFLFIISAIAGVNGDVPWTIYDCGGGSSGSCEQRLGLLEFDTKFGGTTTTTKWSDCNTDPCDKCDKAGKATLSFLVFAMIANIVALAAQAANLGMKLPNYITVILYVAIFVFLLISWPIWVGGCHEEIRSTDNIDKDKVTLNVAFALAFLAWILSAITAALELGAESLGEEEAVSTTAV
ncbi:hypothetical protein AAMO2058_001580200 [Amorphochlora amoebiformis]